MAAADRESQPTLRAYVSAREDERLKPTDLRNRPSQRQKHIEDALGHLPIEIRQIIRHDLEEGRLAKKRLDLLSKGLRTIPGLDVDILLHGKDSDVWTQTPAFPPKQIATATGLPLTSSEMDILKNLVERLSNSEEMKRAGLELDGRRIRMAAPPKTTIVRPDELTLLCRFAGLDG